MSKILEDQKITLNQIQELIENTGTNDISLFGDILFSAFEMMINHSQINDVLLLLESGLIKETSERITYFNAYRDYILGRIVYEGRRNGYKSFSEYFESSFKQLENDSITELTWKVLVALTLLYYERGNYHNAKKPRIYAIELINMIAESISDPAVRSKYLERKDRKEALELLKKISSEMQRNEFQQS